MSDDAEFLARLRAKLAASDDLDAERIAELEIHVQDAADDLDTESLTREEKLLVAAHRLGVGGALEDEFRKVTPLASWRTPVYWAAAGVAWTLGAEAIFELAVPIGGLARSVFGFSVAALVAWIFFVYVVGPIITFGSVGMWMRSRPANDPASRRALFITVLVAFAIRLASVPLIRPISHSAWRGIDNATWRLVLDAWQLAAMMGIVLVAGAGAFVFARLRRPIDVARQ